MPRPLLPLPLLLALLLGACQHRTAAPDTLDGLYFIETDSTSRTKLLLLENGLFELLEGNVLSRRGTFEAREGLLRLKPAGTGTGAVFETTYAVVEGRLLLGVLRRIGGERERWTSAAPPGELLNWPWGAQVRAEGFRIDWDLSEGEWRLTSGTRRVELRGVARLEDPSHAERAFVPVFRPQEPRAEGEGPSAVLADKGARVGMEWGVLSPFGLEAAPEAPLVWDGERVRPRDGGAEAWKALARGLNSFSGSIRSLVYERRGDIVVTPWTVDLGPVGLTPIRAEPSAVAATYVSGAEELVVSELPPPPEAEDYALRMRDPSEEQTCHYDRPDARGLVVWTLREAHHPMGHWDKPIQVFCFALADGRVARYVSAGGCGGKSARLDVFQRRASP